ncbi:protein LLP-like [Liolophura sinensis]|uniref:protein LLP-like n=1 Tax=Liolophura sinensis TaxID=3198878 RepID=UPI003158DD69
MAKSIRSKWKRKMRKVKRVRYAKRELDTLKKVAEGAKIGALNGDNELYTIVTKDELQKQKEEKEAKRKTEEALNKMETDQVRKFDKKTMKDENGQYPVWMNQRAINKVKNSMKKGRKKKGKQRGKWKQEW